MKRKYDDDFAELDESIYREAVVRWLQRGLVHAPTFTGKGLSLPEIRRAFCLHPGVELGEALHEALSSEYTNCSRVCVRVFHDAVRHFAGGTARIPVKGGGRKEGIEGWRIARGLGIAVAATAPVIVDVKPAAAVVAAVAVARLPRFFAAESAVDSEIRGALALVAVEAKCAAAEARAASAEERLRDATARFARAEQRLREKLRSVREELGDTEQRLLVATTTTTTEHQLSSSSASSSRRAVLEEWMRSPIFSEETRAELAATADSLDDLLLTPQTNLIAMTSHWKPLPRARFLRELEQWRASNADDSTCV